VLSVAMEKPAAPARSIDLAQPVRCVIRVQGTLDAAWSDYLGGLRITPVPAASAGRGAVSQLNGRLPDQAALIGILNSLYDLGLPLLSVSCRAEGVGRRAKRETRCASDRS
jgi:hypothetical protein